MGEVQYIDHATSTPPASFFRPTDYLFKRLAFQHEREVRVGTYSTEVHMEFFDNAGILKTPAAGVTAEKVLNFPDIKGVYVEIDVPELIDKVVVSPLSPDWFSDLVVSVSNKLD